MSEKTNMTVTAPDPATLIDREMIRAADAARDATNRAAHEARLALDAAKAALAGATAKADAAAATGAGLLEAEQQVAAAELHLRAAQRRVAATANAVAAAPSEHRQQVGEAHTAAVRELVRQVIACHKAGAEAKASIIACEQRMQALQATINSFHHVGARGLRNAENRPGLLRDVADEVRLFAANGIDFSEDKQ